MAVFLVSPSESHYAQVGAVLYTVTVPADRSLSVPMLVAPENFTNYSFPTGTISG